MVRTETPKRLFALDENFPYPLIDGLRVAFEDFAELVSLRDISDDLLEVDDWELLLRLHQHERSWDGLITNDEAMLSLAKEMTVLDQTGLTLVVAKGQGHNAIRATGVLPSPAYLPSDCSEQRADLAVYDQTKGRRKPGAVSGADRAPREPHHSAAHGQVQGWI
jgi:hypothetical protein